MRREGWEEDGDIRRFVMVARRAFVRATLSLCTRFGQCSSIPLHLFIFFVLIGPSFPHSSTMFYHFPSLFQHFHSMELGGIQPYHHQIASWYIHTLKDYPFPPLFRNLFLPKMTRWTPSAPQTPLTHFVPESNFA